MAAIRTLARMVKNPSFLSSSQTAAACLFSRHIHAEKCRPPKYFKERDLFLDDLPEKIEPRFKFKEKEAEKEKGKGKKKKSTLERRPLRSFKQRTEAYMLPFTLDVFISKKYIHASIMHRVTNKVVAVASTNSKDLRSVLKSRCDISACRVVGEILAERAKEADVFTSIYYTRKNEKLEGKLLAVVDSVREHGINLLM